MSFYTQIKDAVDNFYTSSTWSGETATRTPVTKTISNTYGDETLTEGTAETIDCYVSLDFKKTNRYFVSKEGEVEAGDAFILVKSTQTLNKNDIIEHNDRKYRVADIYEIIVNGTLCGKQGNLFLIE